MSGSNPAIEPHCLEAEESVLGAVLVDESHLEGLVTEVRLKPEHFFREQHGWVFAAMLDLREHARTVNPVTVVEELRDLERLDEVGGADLIQELAQRTAGAEHAREFGRIVREHADMRDLLRRTRVTF